MSHVREEPMQLYHKYRQSDHNIEDSVNEKAILSSAASRELLLADMLVNMVPPLMLSFHYYCSQERVVSGNSIEIPLI